jgi:hypothetical protein
VGEKGGESLRMNFLKIFHSIKKNQVLRDLENQISAEYPYIGKWFFGLRKPAVRSVIKHNFLREASFGNFDSSFFNFAEFSNGFNDYLSRKIISGNESMLFEDYISNKKLAGNKIPSGNQPTSFLTYQRAYDFFRYVIGGWGRGALTLNELRDRRPIRKMIENTLSDGDLVNWKGKISNPRGFFWATKEDSIPFSLRAVIDDAAAAERIRSLLGLAHFKSCGMVETRILQKYVTNTCRTPTICDGGTYPYYRPAKRNDYFGCAVDIQKKDTGLPEAVCSELDWNSSLKPRYIGDIKISNGEFNAKDWTMLLRNSERTLLRFISGKCDEA